MMRRSVRSVLIVDDSATMRRVLQGLLLQHDPSFRIDLAENGEAALHAVEKNKYDAMVLDLDMPGIGGIDILPKIKSADADLAVLIVSALARRDAEISSRALHAGALDFMAKPDRDHVKMFKDEFVARTEALISLSRQLRAARLAKLGVKEERRLILQSHRSYPRPDVIAIGASAGGPQALFRMVAELDDHITQPVIVIQHMPYGFTSVLARQLARHTRRHVAEAQQGMILRDNAIVIAPGDRHLRFEKRGNEVCALLTRDPPVHFCRPAFDVTLQSLMAAYDNRILAVMLTGMGVDGRDSCRTLFDKGGAVLAQDETSSAVWGMPGAVALEGICAAVASPPGLAHEIARMAA